MLPTEGFIQKGHTVIGCARSSDALDKIPFKACQPIWGGKLTRLGVSPQPIPYHKVSEETLAAAIEIVLGDKVMRCKAQELGQKIRSEDGVANAVEAFHRHLGLIE